MHRGSVGQLVVMDTHSGSDNHAELHVHISENYHHMNMGLNWLKMRALVALFTFELGPPHIDHYTSGGSSEEASPKACTRSRHGVI